MAQTRIFNSHSHQDNDWCRAFAAALTAIGYDVWYDETGLQGGDAWVKTIQHEVESRDIFLLVLTPEAWESQWVQDELQLAIATRKRILPVLLRNTQVRGFLLTTQWITVVGEEPQAAARAAVLAVEAPPAPGRNAAPQAPSETLDDLLVLCRSLATEGRYTEALSACSRALALDSKNAGVLAIKAWVLHAIGEYRLEGRTLYVLLSVDPVNSYLIQHDRLGAMIDSLSEDELLQAYSLLRSTELGYEDLGIMARPDRFIRLETGEDILAQVSSGVTRENLLGHLRLTQRLDLAIRLLETWYGYPPSRATLDDMPLLDVYAKALVTLGRADDARPIHQHIVRIVEEAHGSPGALFQPGAPFHLRFQSPWHDFASGRRYGFKIYLAALEAIGRSMDAELLRKAYLGPA